MASKRKTNGRTSVQSIMRAVNKIGCEVREFFAQARHLKYVEQPGFNPALEALRFKELRDKGFVERHPGWEVNAGVVDFSDEINASATPRQVYAGQKQYALAQVKGFRPPTMTRPAPSYA